ncbi:MAG: hypothetical protein M1839_007596 [Geoglossum umbratile]|nr:MAG: hypothetical protein M1839_007596 [Geoglossum umbratile]
MRLTPLPEVGGGHLQSPSVPETKVPETVAKRPQHARLGSRDIFEDYSRGPFTKSLDQELKCPKMPPTYLDSGRCRVSSSNYEADDEDNLVSEFIPSVGSLKEHEAKRADRAERYTRVWGYAYEDSLGQNTETPPIRLICNTCVDDRGEDVSHNVAQSIERKEVVLTEPQPSTPISWKRTDIMANRSPSPSRASPSYGSWNATLTCDGKVYEVDSATADLRNGFLELVSTVTDLKNQSRHAAGTKSNPHGWYDIVNIFEHPHIADSVAGDGVATAGSVPRQEFNAAQLPLFTE